MPVRRCPACKAASIPTKELIVSDARCPACGKIVGPQWLVRFVVFLVLAAVTTVTTVIVLAQFGVYAALLWFSFPIGTLGYLKARFAPLVVRRQDFAG